MTLEEGFIMALVLTGIGIPLLIFAYYRAFKNYEEKKQQEEDAKKSKPWKE
jgi:hypothetical protein